MDAIENSRITSTKILNILIITMVEVISIFSTIAIYQFRKLYIRILVHRWKL